jgi:protein TonB
LRETPAPAAVSTPPPVRERSLVEDAPVPERPGAASAVDVPVAAPVVAPPAMIEAFDPPVETGTDESEIARYVALVRTRVDERKVYPAIARRRGVEGRVVARLRIDESGRLLRLETERGTSAVLGRSARSAIEAASPFPPPPDGEFELEIALQYSLDAS